jgi:aldehyde dehydrogenase (NAD+)
MLIGPGKSKIVYEPLGVICIMGSWNFPLFTTLGPLIAVIAAGNCAVVKPSEFSPNTTKKIKSLIARYLDGSAYVCLEGQVQVAIALTSKRFDGIVFTGSTEKGKLVAAAAAKNLVPCLLELGGKCPSVVDQSSDLDFAAKKIVLGRYINSGQVCISPDYVLVPENKKDKFIELLKKHITAFWSDGANVADMGKVVNNFHQNRLCDLFTDIEPSQIVCGNPNVLQDRKLTPTVVLNPAKDSLLMKDEIFGPILPLITYIEFDEVVKYINSMEKPLAIYYFGSSSGSNYQRLEKETSSGALINNEVLF